MNNLVVAYGSGSLRQARGIEESIQGLGISKQLIPYVWTVETSASVREVVSLLKAVDDELVFSVTDIVNANVGVSSLS